MGIGVSVDAVSAAERDPKYMDKRHLTSMVAVRGGSPARGLRVHVSDASPHGFWGHVIGVHGEAVRVNRDNGARELVMLSRRRVTVVNDECHAQPARSPIGRTDEPVAH